MIADALAIPIKQGSATVVLADEKRLDARNNLLGMDLDDNLWIPFVQDTVYTMMNNYRQGMSQAPYTYVNCGNIPYCDIPLSQIWNSQVNSEYHESSDMLQIVS